MTDIHSIIRDLASRMAYARTGKLSATVSAQDYHMAVVAYKKLMTERDELKLTLEGMDLKYLHFEDSVLYLDVWAGAHVGAVILEALQVRDKTGKEVVFVFNDKVFTVRDTSTETSLLEMWNAK